MKTPDTHPTSPDTRHSTLDTRHSTLDTRHLPLKLAEIRPNLEFRARFFSALRSFYQRHDFIEVHTPVRLVAPAAEEYIEAPQSEEKFLRTSPELEMKCMLAAGYEKIFQMGPCFRKGEKGRLHREEFTMLEWYQAEASYTDLLDFTQNMLKEAVFATKNSKKVDFRGKTIDFGEKWEILTVHEAFAKFADTTPEKTIEDDNFEEILVEKIEPHLGWGRPTALIDYPTRFSAFAQLKPDSDPPVAERWEIYLGGIEIANAYGELTDPKEQRQRFAEFAATRKKLGFAPYPEPVEFLEALDQGIPPSSGCALGLDRLIMVLTDAVDIDQVAF